MATTSPDNLRTPNPGDPYNLVADLAVLANDVQDALVSRANSYTGTAAQRASFASSAPEGALWVDTDGDKHVWKNDGGTWVRLVPDVEDTGWIQLNGWTGSFTQATNPVHYRRIGKDVIFKGALSNNAWEGSFTHFGVTMPVGFRPLGTERYFNLPSNSTNTAKRLCQIRPNGQVLLYGEGKSAAWWNFDQVRYRTD